MPRHDAPTLPATATAVRPAAPADERPRAPAAPRLRSPDLFGSAVEIEIEHGQQVYRLRKTSLGKLILTK
jgi:hemin uptake protein HemP